MKTNKLISCFIGILAALTLSSISGCTMLEEKEEAAPPPARVYRPPITLRAIGYGTVRPDKGLTVNQMKLMAMRSSRMDAYRNLTEQVYGVQITGTTTVGAMVVNSDSYKGFVNGLLHSARLVSVQPLTDNFTYETILELTVGDDFYEFSNRIMATSVSSSASSASGATYTDRYYYNSH